MASLAPTNTIATIDQPVRTLWGDAFRRLLRNRLALIGLAIVLGAIFCALCATWIAPYSPIKGDLNNTALIPPSLTHLLGTDYLGRDILSRIIFGAQISLRVALLAEGLGLLIGTVIGLITGYFGGILDNLLMRLVDVLMAFPLLIIAIAFISALGRSEVNLILALALVIWPLIARLARSQVLSIKETDYILAARSLGTGSWGIMFRHILPNILTPLVVYGTLGTANIILQEAALSFLGLGVGDQSIPSWGKMLNEAREYIRSAPWMAFYPGLAILMVVMGLNLLGDGLRDALDVRSR